MIIVMRRGKLEGGNVEGRERDNGGGKGKMGRKRERGEIEREGIRERKEVTEEGGGG